MASPANPTADYLILYAHPNPKSLNHAILGAVIEGLKAAKKSYVVRDLYELKWDPTLAPADFIAMQDGTQRPDVAHEQALVKAAKHIIVIHPLWWFSVPALLKGWVDRVFSRGFAYGWDPKVGILSLLKGRKVTLFTTTGGPVQQYEGPDELKKAITKTIDDNIFKFSGFEVNKHIWMHNVAFSTEQDRKKWIAEAKDIAFNL